jgi:hypothetical protein
MTALLPPTLDSDRRPAFPRAPRRTVGQALVAVLYVLLVVASPWLVRFAPAPDRMVAVATRDSLTMPRCATAPESGVACPVGPR